MQTFAAWTWLGIIQADVLSASLWPLPVAASAETQTDIDRRRTELLYQGLVQTGSCYDSIQTALVACKEECEKSEKTHQKVAHLIDALAGAQSISQAVQ